VSIEEIVIPRPRRGRKPKPPAEPPDELAGPPDKPPIVKRNKVASRLWDQLVPMLATTGIVGPPDALALAVACLAYARMVAAAGVLDRAESLTVTSETGVVKAHPMLVVEQTARRDLAGALDKLGMSPTARARIAYLKTRPKSSLDPDALDFDDDIDDAAS
jgi:P27 family predicted phage terminase small subunit